MRELRIVQQHGQVVVTTSDGRRAVGAQLPSAFMKLFGPQDWGPLHAAFLEIKPGQDRSQIVEGQAGA